MSWALTCILSHVPDSNLDLHTLRSSHASLSSCCCSLSPLASSLPSPGSSSSFYTPTNGGLASGSTLSFHFFSPEQSYLYPWLLWADYQISINSNLVFNVPHKTYLREILSDCRLCGGKEDGSPNVARHMSARSLLSGCCGLWVVPIIKRGKQPLPQ